MFLNLFIFIWNIVLDFLLISGPEEVIHVLDGEEQKVCSPKNNAINDATYYATGKVIYPSAIKTQMREYCEEEMWVWVFPNHECQKSCGILICKEFLAWVLSQCTHMWLDWLLQISNFTRQKNLWNWCWSKAMYSHVTTLTFTN